MKKLVLLTLFLFALAAAAQNTTITGTLSGPAFGTTFNGVVQLTLYVPATVPATVGCGGSQPYYVIPQIIQLQVVNGVVQGSGRPVWGADCLSIPQDPYKVVIRDLLGNQIVSDYWLIQGNTFDVGDAQSAVPIIPPTVLAVSSFSAITQTLAPGSNATVSTQYLGSSQWRLIFGIPLSGTSGTAYPGLTGDGFNGLIVTGGVSKYHTLDVMTYGAKVDGTTDDTIAWQLGCAAAQAAGATLTMPAGVSKVTQQICSITNPVGIRGAGPTLSTISVVGSVPVRTVFDVENTSNVEIGNLGIAGTTSASTGLATGIVALNSQHLNFHDLSFQQIGYATTGINPIAAIYTEHDDDVMLNTIQVTKSGSLGFEFVNGYNGQISTRMHWRNITDANGASNIDFSIFNCQFCDVLGSTIDQNNVIGDVTASGYGVLFYATNTTYALNSGCTGAGTITCTLPISAGISRLPYASHFRVETLGVTGGTGTLNGTWDATLLSPTTFSFVSSGSNASGANFSAATLYYPTTHNIIAHDNIKNTAGTAIYFQGCQYCLVGSNSLENVDQQQIGTSLTVGGIAFNSGYPPAPVATGDVAVGNIIHGSGQHCYEIANTVDAVISGGSCVQAVNYGVYIAGGSNNNLNFYVGGGLTIDAVTRCFNVLGTSSGTIGGFTCNNFSALGMFFPGPTTGNVHVEGPGTLTATTYIPCIDDFSAGITYSNITCEGGFALLGGTGTQWNNMKFTNTVASGTAAAVQFFGAQHVIVNNLSVDTAKVGLYFPNNGANQNTDITIKNLHLINMGPNVAIADVNPAAVTGNVTSGLNTITVTTGASIIAGMGIGDYAGSNLIPLGATIVNVSGTCSTGCTLTFSGSAATGSNAADALAIQQSMSSNVRIWNADVQGNNPTAGQAFLGYGFQGLDWRGGFISGFSTAAAMDLRGAVNGATISGLSVIESSSVAAVNVPGGALGSASNVLVSNLTTSGTGSFSIEDTGVGTGNAYLGTAGLSLPIHVTNTNATVSASTGAISGTGSPSAGLCVARNKNLLYNQLDASAAGMNVWICNGASWVQQTGTFTGSSLTVGNASCVKSAGPPIVLGFCSTVVGSSGTCTCN